MGEDQGRYLAEGAGTYQEAPDYNQEGDLEDAEEVRLGKNDVTTLRSLSFLLIFMAVEVTFGWALEALVAGMYQRVHRGRHDITNT